MPSDDDSFAIVEERDESVVDFNRVVQREWESKEMRIVDAGERPNPFVGPRTHARLRHDYATWHEDHRHSALTATDKKLPFEDRSKFDSFQIIDEAISRSTEHPATVQDGKNANYVIAFDMGYIVGYDARAKRRTSAVTVRLSPVGEVITVHPGTPWSRDWGET